MEIPVAKLPDYLRRMLGSILSASLAGPLRAVLPVIDAGFMRNFHAAVASTGSPWPPRKDAKTHPLLMESGALAGATQEGQAGNVTEVGDRMLATGVDKSVDSGGIPGAAVHNFGYPPRNIPQREFLYASEETLDQAVEVFADEAVKVLFGG